MSLQIYSIDEQYSDFLVMLVKGDEESILAISTMIETLANLCWWRRLQHLVFLFRAQDLVRLRREERRGRILFIM